MLALSPAGGCGAERSLEFIFWLLLPGPRGRGSAIKRDHGRLGMERIPQAPPGKGSASPGRGRD